VPPPAGRDPSRASVSSWPLRTVCTPRPERPPLLPVFALSLSHPPGPDAPPAVRRAHYIVVTAANPRDLAVSQAYMRAGPEPPGQTSRMTFSQMRSKEVDFALYAIKNWTLTVRALREAIFSAVLRSRIYRRLETDIGCILPEGPGIKSIHYEVTS